MKWREQEDKFWADGTSSPISTRKLIQQYNNDDKGCFSMVNFYFCCWNMKEIIQGWEFALSLFALLLKIAQIIEQLWAIHSCCSLKKGYRELIALVALNNEWLWVIRSGRSWQKSDREQIALDFYKKRAMSATRSQKQMICSRNQWVNYQTWLSTTEATYV